MIPTTRSAWPALLVFSLLAPGCNEPSNVSDSFPAPAPPIATPSPAEVAKPAPAEESKPAAVVETSPTPAATEPAPEVAANPTGKLPSDVFQASPVKADAAPATESAANDAIQLVPVKYDEFVSRVAANKTAKYTLVDAWATWCLPCRENFPHLVEMNTKYADKGLAVVSLSFDDLSNAKVVGEAKKFLTEKRAVFANYLLDEADGVGFEKFDVNTIPAVFIFGPGAKLVKKFSLDDPDHQFTYDQVEEAVVALLDGKPLPKDDKAPSPKK